MIRPAFQGSPQTPRHSCKTMAARLNPIIRRENYPGLGAPAPKRAARHHGMPTARKRIKRVPLGPLPMSAAVPVLHATLPIRTVNALNAREHWAVKSKRAAKQREAARYILQSLSPLPVLPWTVYLVRTRPNNRGTMDTTDGLRASLKHIVDAIAESGGVDDADEANISVEYDQQVDREYGYGVRVRIETRREGAE
jgi:hypothetical protein